MGHWTSSRGAAVLLLLLIAADLAFVVLFALQGFHLLDDSAFEMTRDRTHPELFQYLKTFWIALLFATLGVARRQRSSAVFAGVFAYFLVDDYAELHEKLGDRLSQLMAIPDLPMMEATDVGEFLVFGGYAALVLTMLLLVWPRSDGTERRLARDSILLLALAAVFAVGVDLVNGLPWPELISDGFGALEEGGEMVAISTIVWRVFDEVIRDGDRLRPLHPEVAESASREVSHAG